MLKRLLVDDCIILVGGFSPSEKLSQLGLLFPIYGKEKMFQTTNQMRVLVYW
jgi:hypothetical protein